MKRLLLLSLCLLLSVPCFARKEYIEVIIERIPEVFGPANGYRSNYVYNLTDNKIGRINDNDGNKAYFRDYIDIINTYAKEGWELFPTSNLNAFEDIDLIFEKLTVHIIMYRDAKEDKKEDKQ